jgi:hypothetical protein
MAKNADASFVIIASVTTSAITGRAASIRFCGDVGNEHD